MCYVTNGFQKDAMVFQEIQLIMLISIASNVEMVVLTPDQHVLLRKVEIERFN